MRIRSKKNNKNKNCKYILEDSSDIIENDDYVGEIIPKNLIIIKTHKNKIRSKSPINRIKKGIVIEERNNYQFFASGIEYSDINIVNNKKYINERKNINLDTQIKTENNELTEIPYLKYNQNDYNLSKNRKMESIETYLNYEKEINNEKNKNNNFKVNNQKTPYNFKNTGFLRDSSNGQLYKIYQVIPIDINNEKIEEVLQKNKNYLNNNYKKIYGNKNNFLINSIDIDNNSINNNVFQKPIITRKIISNTNIYNNYANDYKNITPKIKLNSLDLDNQSISLKDENNNIFQNADDKINKCIQNKNGEELHKIIK